MAGETDGSRRADVSKLLKATAFYIWRPGWRRLRCYGVVAT